MRMLLVACGLTAFSSVAPAQTCLDPNYGTLLAVNQTDVLLPPQAIGFPFPIGSTTYTDIHITDHGFVQFSNGGMPSPVGGSLLYTPTEANFALSTAKVAALYTDVIGQGGGMIFLNSTPTQCMVSWIDMQCWGLPTPRLSFQLTLFANGDLRVVYDPNCTNNSTFLGVAVNGIVGITEGNVTLPPQVDLSANGSVSTTSVHELWAVANTFDLKNKVLLMTALNPGYAYATVPANCADAQTFGTGCNGLGLAPLGLPQLGNATFRLLVTGVPQVSPVAFVAFGSLAIDPGTNLTPLGMTSCSGYTNLSFGMFATGPVTNGTGALPYPIPNIPAAAGTFFSAQGISLSLANPFGLTVSNGMRLLIGF